MHFLQQQCVELSAANCSKEWKIKKAVFSRKILINLDEGCRKKHYIIYLSVTLELSVLEIILIINFQAGSCMWTNTCFQDHTHVITRQTKGSGVKWAPRNFAHNIFVRRHQPHKHEWPLMSHRHEWVIGVMNHTRRPLLYMAMFTCGCLRVNAKIEHYSGVGAQTLPHQLRPGFSSQINMHACAPPHLHPWTTPVFAYANDELERERTD